MSEQFESIGKQGDQAHFVTLDGRIGDAGEQAEAWRAHSSDRQKLQYVVKLFRTASGAPGKANDDFTRECDTLAALAAQRHPNIVRIIDSGDSLMRGDEPLPCPFYIMESLGKDVVTLDEVLDNKTIHGDQKLLLCLCSLKEVAAALACIHQERYYHADIKESNVLISGSATQFPKITLIDFGFAHPLVPGQPAAKLPQKASSIRWQGHKPISADNNDIFQLCYMVKRSISRCRAKLNDVTANGTLPWPMDYAVFSLLQDLLARWASEDTDSLAETATPGAFYGELGELMRGSDLAPDVRGAEKYLSIPEIATAAQLCQAFEALRIPPRQLVLYTEPIKKLITTPQFGGLRYVRQLGFTHLVYPGAQGTRFEHSLGVYDLACHVAIRLSGHEAFRRVCNSEHDILKFIVAALLHDVGHFPYSHQLEEFRKHNFSQQVWRRVQNLVGGHEYRGRAVIQGLSEVLHDLFNFTPEDIDDINWLALGDRDKESSGADSSKPRDDSLSFLRTLIDGPVDMDKLDYIERDAHHCGVPYGSYIDIARICETMRVLPPKDGKTVLAFDKRAVGCLEQFATARHELYANVYWHRAVRSATVMFKHAFYLFQELAANRKLLENLFYGTVADDCLIDHMNQWTMKLLREQHTKPGVSKKARAILALLQVVSGKERVLYKAILERDREDSSKALTTDTPFGGQKYGDQRKKAAEIFNELKKKGFLSAEANKIEEHNVLIDCHTDDFPRFEKIMIVKGPGLEGTPLTVMAPSVGQLQANFIRQACKIRVFVNPKALKSKYQSKAGRAEVGTFIEKICV
ncbi:MAG: HD domain-containing protein [Terracidiphilus sp.]|jgi:HD superfamily phosphohydrolase